MIVKNSEIVISFTQFLPLNQVKIPISRPECQRVSVGRAQMLLFLYAIKPGICNSSGKRPKVRWIRRSETVTGVSLPHPFAPLPLGEGKGVRVLGVVLGVRPEPVEGCGD
jgi:hypothetical protein